MSTTTANLGLFKYDTSTDANIAFSIDNALNNNWNILDETVNNKLSSIDSFSENGYVKFSNRLVIEWRSDFSHQHDGFVNGTVTFPLAFTEVYSIATMAFCNQDLMSQETNASRILATRGFIGAVSGGPNITTTSFYTNVTASFIAIGII